MSAGRWVLTVLVADPRFRRIGIGRERDLSGRLWLVQVFKDPA